MYVEEDIKEIEAHRFDSTLKKDDAGIPRAVLYCAVLHALAACAF